MKKLVLCAIAWSLLANAEAPVTTTPAPTAPADRAIKVIDNDFFNKKEDPGPPRTTKGAQSETERYVAEPDKINTQQRDRIIEECSAVKQDSKGDCYRRGKAREVKALEDQKNSRQGRGLASPPANTQAPTESAPSNSFDSDVEKQPLELPAGEAQRKSPIPLLLDEQKRNPALEEEEKDKD